MWVDVNANETITHKQVIQFNFFQLDQVNSLSEDRELFSTYTFEHLT
jgi:hypothetical protein